MMSRVSVDCAMLRREKKAARAALSEKERFDASEAICARIASSPGFCQAETILLYRAVKGEVQLEPLARVAFVLGKRVAYPRCFSECTMRAYVPEDDAAWDEGRYGILEPSLSRSSIVQPTEFDLVVCPCTAFDETGNRLGMGAGYYDRYLPLCNHAEIVAVAFDVQRASSIPAMPWDFRMNCVYTESKEYRISRDVR